MQYRQFGQTDMRISSLGFGAWAIGGNSYGAVSDSDAIAALHRAEELGCNFVDTAEVYGESETLIGRFLEGRRDKWYVASKFSGQPQGMTALVEQQLQALNTDYIDFYQIHWAPDASAQHLYTELEQLKQSGKVRYVGVSLYNEGDIDYVLKQSVIDGFQVKFGLLDPMPLLSRLTQIENSGLGVIVRSSLKEGFLTGKFKPGVSFSAANDQRSEWTAGQIAMTLKQVEALRFLETAERSLLCSAIHYPLQFSAVSTVIVGTKNDQQAKANFTDSGVVSFTDDEMESIQRLQRKMGLLYNPDGGLGRVSALMATVKKRLF